MNVSKFEIALDVALETTLFVAGPYLFDSMTPETTAIYVVARKAISSGVQFLCMKTCLDHAEQKVQYKVDSIKKLGLKVGEAVGDLIGKPTSFVVGVTAATLLSSIDFKTALAFEGFKFLASSFFG
jgi:hypothetical protein